MRSEYSAGGFRYDSFISYRHTDPDRVIAERLHRSLETYRVPDPLVKRGVPRQIKRVFRDREELPTSSNLGDDITRALEESRYLVVVCSPRTPASRWVEKEVQTFLDLGRGDRIIPLLIEGEPEESLPIPLRRDLDEAPKLETDRDAPISLVDLRAESPRRSPRLTSRERLRLVARILGCSFPELELRDRERSIRRKTALAAAAFLLVSAFGMFNYSQWMNAEEHRRITKTERDRAMAAISLLTYAIPAKLEGIPGTLPASTALLEENVELLDRILSLSPDSREAKREKSVNFTLSGDRWLLLGNSSKSRDAYEKALNIDLVLARDESSARAQRDLSISYERIGDVRKTQGDLQAALEAYEKRLAMAVELARDESNAWAQQDLSISYTNVGNVKGAQGDLRGALEAYEKALAIDLVLARDKTNLRAQQDLSASYNSIGDVMNARGDLRGAMEAYEKGLAIAIELARDESNARAQQDLSISYNKVGDVREARGDLLGATEAYEKALAIRQRLARDKSNARAQRDLSVSYNNVGSVREMLGDLPGALEAYEKGLAIALELARDKSNAEAQRDLSFSWERVGDVRYAEGNPRGALDAYEKGLVIRQELARDDTNAEVQRDLASSYQRMGVVRGAQGDLRGALEAHEKGLAIRQGLARDKSNLQAQQDLSISYDMTGGARLRLGDVMGAREATERALAIASDLVRADDTAETRRNLAITHGDLAWVELVDRRPEVAVSSALKGLEADPSQVWIKTNLAHGYLLDGQFEKAKAIYVDNRDVRLGMTRTFAEAALSDFKEFRARGINHPDMDKIEQLLKAP